MSTYPTIVWDCLGLDGEVVRVTAQTRQVAEATASRQLGQKRADIIAKYRWTISAPNRARDEVERERGRQERNSYLRYLVKAKRAARRAVGA